MTNHQLSALVRRRVRQGIGDLVDLSHLRVVRRHTGPGTPHEILRCDRTGRRVVNVL